MLDEKTIGKMYRSNFGWEVLVDLTKIGDRSAGSEGEYRAAQRIAEAFKDAGLRDVKVNEFPIQGWKRGPAELIIQTPLQRAYPTIGLPRSPTGVVNAQMVDLGFGLPEDFAKADLQGKIALVVLAY